MPGWVRGSGWSRGRDSNGTLTLIYIYQVERGVAFQALSHLGDWFEHDVVGARFVGAVSFVAHVAYSQIVRGALVLCCMGDWRVKRKRTRHEG